MTGRRAFTLVEVLIAALVLVMVIVPLIGLLTSGKTDQQSEEGMSEAVAFCQEMMEKIISNNMPFQAIDPGGGAGPTGLAGLNVKQAGFRDAKNREQEFKGTDLEKIVNDEPGSGARVRKVKGKRYEVFFFAGKYPDRPPIDDSHETGYKRADIEQTLTFSYLEKPAGYGQPYNFKDSDRTKFNRQTILAGDKVDLGNIESSPYLLGSYLVAGGAVPVSERIAAPQNQSYFYKEPGRMFPDKPGQQLISGWPNPKPIFSDFEFNLDQDNQREIWAKNLLAVAKRTQRPTIAYHPVTIDQKTFKETGGAFMKLALGVRFSPYTHSHLRKDTGDNKREFWLVSFKSNLED
jgi:type II secretory pathway pseudopilin PulG